MKAVTRDRAKKKTSDPPLVNRFLAGAKSIRYGAGEHLFQQGSQARDVFLILDGKVKLSTVSRRGKEAVVAILGAGDFLGEAAMQIQLVRVLTATAITDCSALYLSKESFSKALQESRNLNERFIKFMLQRNARIEADLIDQLFNSTEKRLARALLLLSRNGGNGTHKILIPRMSQEVLAEMIGTTRTRINFFMNRFRKLGFIKYNGGIEVLPSLVDILLHD